MKGHVSRRLELSSGVRSAELIRHSRMYSGKEAHPYQEHEHRMDEPNSGSKPPAQQAAGQEGFDVDQGEDPAVKKVDQNADPFGFVAVRRKYGSEHEWDIHSR